MNFIMGFMACETALIGYNQCKRANASPPVICRFIQIHLLILISNLKGKQGTISSRLTLFSEINYAGIFAIAALHRVSSHCLTLQPI